MGLLYLKNEEKRLYNAYVFESQEECDEEQKRLDEIEAEYRKNKADYLKNCKGE